MNILLLMEYDGSLFSGSQRQNKGENTVQKTVERALEGALSEKVSLVFSGRTDAGVHALGQVANFHVKTLPFDIKKLIRVLNKRLYWGDLGIVIRAVKVVDDSFNARFEALSKTYIYSIRFGFRGASIFSKYSWCIKWKLDIDAMAKAALVLEGENDFRSFARRLDPDQKTKRRLDKVEILPHNSQLLIKYQAPGFLRGQIRLMTGALVQVGRGKRSEQDLQRMLMGENKGSQCCPVLAPAAGLYLIKVHYPFGLEEQYEDLYSQA